MERRDFMKAGAAAAMGGLSLGSLPSRLVAQPPTADAIRVGLIGCGGRGTGAAVQALSTAQDVKLVAMADAFQDQVDRCHAALTSTERDEWLGGTSDLSSRIDVPAELLDSRLSPSRRKQAQDQDLHVLSLTLRATKPA